MGNSLASWAPYIGAAVVGIVYLAIKLHGEAMKYVAEVQFFLNQKTLAYNKANASLSIVKSKVNEIQKQQIKLEQENKRLRKSLELTSKLVDQQKAQPAREEKKEDQIDPSVLEKIESELEAINNVLNRDLKTQLKNYSREVDWLTKRLSEVQSQFSKVNEEEKISNLEDLSYKDVA